MSLTIGTLNVRGLTKDLAKRYLAQDLENFNLDICSIQETKIGKLFDHITIKTPRKKIKYDVYLNSNTNNFHHGVGIAIKSCNKGHFERISERICKITCDDLRINRKIRLVAAYAPTSKTNQTQIDRFYLDVTNALNNSAKRDVLIIAGDMNAKVGSAEDRSDKNLGLYGKGKTNSSRQKLLDLARLTGLVITNTLFYHKMSHRTTWTQPNRSSNLQRRNPHRNQIDFILIRVAHRNLIRNARSHGNISTVTDHKLVRTNLDLKSCKCFGNQNKNPNYDVRKLLIPVIRYEYQKSQMENYKRMSNTQEHKNPQITWSNITKASIKAANEILKQSKQKQNWDEEELVKLSKEQKNIRDKIMSLKQTNQCALNIKMLCHRRNKLLRKIHKFTEHQESYRIDEAVKDIDSIKNDSNRMYHASRFIKSCKKGKI